MSDDQMTTRGERHAFVATQMRSLLHTVPSFGMMQSRACDAGTTFFLGFEAVEDEQGAG